MEKKQVYAIKSSVLGELGMACTLKISKSYVLFLILMLGEETDIGTANKIGREVIILICMGVVQVGNWPITSMGLN